MATPTRVQPVDLKVGEAIRTRRKNTGMSQDQLADAIGVSPQQIQKYERGGSRISASRLHAVARAMAYFFAGIDDEQFAVFAAAIDEKTAKLMQSAEGAELAELFPLLQDSSVRRQVVELVRTLTVSLRTEK